jgi:lipopolysaccharide export system permease protein
MAMFFQRLILDRYILWTFTKVALVAFVSFAGLYLVIDGMNNLEELTTHAKAQSGWFPIVVARYYAPQLLVLFDQTAGLLAVAAAMLTIMLMQRNQEVTALLAAGIPKMRIARPLLIGAVAISLLGVANRELLLPKVRDRLSYNAQDLSGQLGRTVTPRYDNHTLLMFSGAKVYPKFRRISAPQVRLPSQFSEWGKRIQAAEAFHVKGQDDRPAGFHFKQVTLPAELPSLHSVSFEGAPVLLSPSDTPWLKPDECFVVSELPFEQLTGKTSFRRYLSTSDLIGGLNNRSLDFGSDVKVIVHHRFLAPLLDFTVLMLGLPLVLRRENRNIFVAAGVCAMVVAAYYVATLASHAAGANYLLKPALAAWLPLAIFAPAAYTLARPLWD